MRKTILSGLFCLAAWPVLAEPAPGSTPAPAANDHGNATYRVCASGCQYADPAAALTAAIAAIRTGGPDIVIRIADGVYTERGQLHVGTPLGRRISLIGNESDPARVVLDFADVSGTNQNGIAVTDGGSLGRIDGLTVNGMNLQSSSTNRGTSWHPQSFGAGILARGRAYIGLGPHVVVNHFYYSVEADEAAMVNARDGGVVATDAGDVNFMARHNGTIVCPHCHAERAADTTGQPTLGCNFTAEEGGSLWIDGSTGRGSFTGGLCILSGSHAWAHGLVLTGGLGGPQGSGIWATENGYAETEGSKVSGYAIGVYVNNGGGLDLTGDQISGNRGDGVQVDGGHINGSHVASTRNGGFGYHVLHQGVAQAWGSLKATTGNALGVAAVEPAGTLNGFAYQGSSLLLD